MEGYKQNYQAGCIDQFLRHHTSGTDFCAKPQEGKALARAFISRYHCQSDEVV
jgi:hypothetical protein